MSKARHLNVPLVEIYAPLFQTGTKEIIAVGEVYTDGRRLYRGLTSIRYVSVGIVGAVTAPMMLILFFIVRRASNTGQQLPGIPQAKRGRGDKPRRAE